MLGHPHPAVIPTQKPEHVAFAVGQDLPALEPRSASWEDFPIILEGVNDTQITNYTVLVDGTVMGLEDLVDVVLRMTGRRERRVCLASKCRKNLVGKALVLLRSSTASSTFSALAST